VIFYKKNESPNAWRLLIHCP